MARRCDLMGTGPMSGNNVSHSKVKTRRRFEPNLCNVTLTSDTLGQKFKLRVTAASLRTVDFKGGLDGFLLGTKNAKLTDKSRKIKRALVKKVAESETEAASETAPEAA
ncbi:MAG: 50S ribosomal protein L28 [Robiginitomaculum sp.]|nr:50S ribosomal protein L28 [Robiginitomaculum sp.]